MALSLAIAAACLMPTALAAQPEAPAPVGARLVRCHPDFRVPCFVLDDARGTAVEAGAAEQFAPIRIDNGGYTGPATYLSVLVDVSGSMQPAALIAVREVLDQWLATRSTAGRGLAVAVATFGSRRVTDGVTRAPFQRPDEARKAVRALPTRTGNENTALYSAVAVATRQLLAQEPGNAGVRRAMLVITDGRNDVQREDLRLEPSLLGSDQLPRVQQLLDSAGIVPILLGFGEDDAIARPALDSLATGRGRVFTSRYLELGAVGDLIDSANAVLFPPQQPFVSPSDVSRLSRLRRNAGVERVGQRKRIPLDWHPPLMALAGFSGSVAIAEADTAYRAEIAFLARWPLERLLAAALILLLLALAWFLLPAWLWPPVMLERNVVREVAAIETPATPATPARRLVTEVPPRTPDAITGEFPLPS
jgi:hypothetical protein